MAVPTGAAPAVSTLTGWRVCCFSSEPFEKWLSRRDSHPIRRLRKTTCFCYTTGKIWGPVPGTLRSLAGFSGALICLSYPAMRGENGPSGGSRTRNLPIIGRVLCWLSYGRKKKWLARLDSHQDLAD